MTKALLATSILLLLAHELLALRAGQRGGLLVALRRFVLLGLVGASAFGGDAVSIRERLRLLRVVAPGPPPIPFDSTGDALLARRLAAQTPARPFPAGATRAEVDAWRVHVVGQLRALTKYDAASTGDVAVKVESSEEVGAVRRTLLTFAAADGTRIPAYVHEPRGGPPRGAVLVVPGHGAGARSTAGIAPPDYQHAAALALAHHGFVTLTPELRGFGMLSPRGAPSHRAVAVAALEAGSSYKAVVVKDLGRALTVLASWRGVDPGHLGVAGASLGGELAVLLGVLDERVRVVVSQSYGGSVGATGVAEASTDEATQTPHGCHTMPGVNQLVWQEDWFRLVAPRPLLVTRGRRNTPRESEAFAAAVRPAFAAASVPDRFSFAVENGGHEFFVEPVAEFLLRWL